MKEDRIFTTKDNNENNLVLRFKRPTQAVMSKSELEYRVAFSQAFTAGIITNAQVDKALKERGVWTDDSEDVATKMRETIAQLEDSLEDTELSNEEGQAICDEISRLREELNTHSDVYSSVAANTCESMASEARNKFFCVECVVYHKSGLKVYKDVEDFTNRSNESMALDCYRETVIASLEAVTGRELPSDLTSEYAENVWLEQRGLSSEEEQEEKPSETEEPKAKKPRTRKKASKK